ncbi:uncharacterized protein BJ171DRAFT_439195 [Polychytrium aggregatum]|uniref:uncharacterized protein n=1 Tax=Polychytrium aggregatum TaxID=110093 RepID=UPI0022FDC377|nr:uncharacterized protein BJ171DRAFT_439195 [Polychytrium aggregatum]KAI9207538.1 hypothetical protein BJ171DRAFT_439195 [Polychytrium aggregatum]
MTTPLTRGGIQSILSAAPGTPMPAGVVVQLLSIRKAAASQTQSIDRYRLSITDGASAGVGMLSTQLNYMIERELISKGSILRLDKMVCNKIGDKKIIIIIECQALTAPGETIPLQYYPGAMDAMMNDSPANQGARPVPVSAPVAASASASAPAPAPVQRAPPAAGPMGYDNTGSTFAQRPRQPPAQKFQSNAVSHGRTNDPAFPISSLSPYQNRWTIRARAIDKGDIRSWSKNGKQGTLFSVTFVDDSGEIRATAFSEQAVAFHAKIEEGKVYNVSKCTVRPAKKQFSTVQNEYELYMDSNAIVDLCTDSVAVPIIRLNLVKLGALNSIQKDGIADILGVVTDLGSVATITSKNSNKDITKRDITLVDDSGYSVRCTLWGQQAEAFSANHGSVVLIKAAKVSDWGGRTLSASFNSTIMVDPNISETSALQSWYALEGQGFSFKSYDHTAGASSSGSDIISGRLQTCEEIKAAEASISQGDTQGVIFAIQATITFIKTDGNVGYPACTKPRCNKKLTTEGGDWRCSACNEIYSEPTYRYILPLTVADYTGNMWVQAFNEVAVRIVDRSANELQQATVEERPNLIRSSMFKTFNMKIRAKSDVYQGETKIRYAIQSAVPLDYANESKRLLGVIRTLL